MASWASELAVATIAVKSITVHFMASDFVCIINYFLGNKWSDPIVRSTLLVSGDRKYIVFIGAQISPIPAFDVTITEG